MTRRSTRLNRLEYSLYSYDASKESWAVLTSNPTKSKASNQQDLFEMGSYFTCKHMSQKVNPVSYRMGINKTWDSSWYSKYKPRGIILSKLHKDLLLRKYISGVLERFGILVSNIYIKEKDSNFFVRLELHESGARLRKETLIDLNRKKRFSFSFEKS